VSGLLIVGSGGLGRETARAAADGGYDGQVLGFLDDDPARVGTTVVGLPVLGPTSALPCYPDARVVVATGRPDHYTSRPRIVAALDLPQDRYATVVHPAAALAGDTEVGPGSVVLAGVVATSGVRIGAHVALMPSVVLTHETAIEDYATVASAVALSGAVVVAEGAYVGAGSLVRQGLRVGAWALVGMGSLVLAEVPDERLWFGRPATDRGPAPAAGFRAAQPSG
jgi:sugar O-acyltransferase (sialic acid O-acetyltransferase NeuD family)